MGERDGIAAGGLAAHEGERALAAGGAAPGIQADERVDPALQEATALHPDGLRTALAALHGDPVCGA